MPTIWTIGHGVRAQEEFIALLRGAGVSRLVDVRRHPGSRRHPHFSMESLREALAAADIEYRWSPALGGRRRAAPSSRNTAWRNPSFRGYADYMETAPFAEALAALEEAARTPTAIMCAESVWWRCHRALISDALKVRGWDVRHILDRAGIVPHPYTSAARVQDGRLTYDADLPLLDAAADRPGN